jgi:hypothetical protein
MNFVVLQVQGQLVVIPVIIRNNYCIHKMLTDQTCLRLPY